MSKIVAVLPDSLSTSVEDHLRSFLFCSVLAEFIHSFIMSPNHASLFCMDVIHERKSVWDQKLEMRIPCFSLFHPPLETMVEQYLLRKNPCNFASKAAYLSHHAALVVAVINALESTCTGPPTSIHCKMAVQ